MAIELSATVVQLCKPTRRKRDCARNGYSDARGQVYLAPKSEKRAAFWRKKMEEKGYSFAA